MRFRVQCFVRRNVFMRFCVENFHQTNRQNQQEAPQNTWIAEKFRSTSKRTDVLFEPEHWTLNEVFKASNGNPQLTATSSLSNMSLSHHKEIESATLDHTCAFVVENRALRVRLKICFCLRCFQLHVELRKPVFLSGSCCVLNNSVSD